MTDDTRNELDWLATSALAVALLEAGRKGSARLLRDALCAEDWPKVLEVVRAIHDTLQAETGMKLVELQGPPGSSRTH